MPYASDKEVPDYVPKSKAKQWRVVWNSVYDREKKDGKSDKDAESKAFAEANGVAGPNASKKFVKSLQKITREEAEEFADALIAALDAEWSALPGEIRSPLENATLSGVGKGMLEIDVSNAATLARANNVASDYASDRAAELIGRKYDAEGNLIENPDARWAISDTTRSEIRQIVTEAFSDGSSLDDVAEQIQSALEAEAEDSGIFSDARAAMIARTEIANAQARGNFTVWQESGVVQTITWLTSEDENVCPECDGNDQVSVEIGKPFPSGDLYPGAHPLCRCVIVVDELS